MRITILMLVLLPLLTVGCDAYIYVSIGRRKGYKSVPARLYGVSSLILWIAIAVILLLPRRSDEGITGVMWALYSFLTIYLPKIVYTLFSLIGLIPCLFGKRYLPAGRYVGLPLAVILFCAMWWGATFGRRQLEVVDVDVESSRLPSAFDGYRMAQISDLHVGTWGSDTTFVSRVVDSVNNLRPDIIFFTGDIVNRETKEILPFVKVLSRLHAPDGVYSILGNHDYGDYKDWPDPKAKAMNLQSLKDIQKKMGWRMLNNDHVFIRRGNDSIALIGVENWGEPPFRQYGELAKAYPSSPRQKDNVNDSKFKILLTHNPEHWNRHVSYETNIDLTLSGHTHAMQIMLGSGRFRWSPSMYIYEQWGGMYERENGAGSPLRIYVNIGCGEVGMPYRIGADSEITLITLRSSGNGRN